MEHWSSAEASESWSYTGALWIRSGKGRGSPNVTDAVSGTVSVICITMSGQTLIYNTHLHVTFMLVKHLHLC